MLLSKKFFIILLNIFSVILIFIIGIFIGIKTNRFFLTNLPLDNSQHYLFNLAKKYKPSYYSGQIIYRGTLIEITDKNIILLKKETLTKVNIPLDQKLNNLITYSIRETSPIPSPSSREAFKYGDKIIAIINFDFLTNDISGINLVLNPVF